MNDEKIKIDSPSHTNNNEITSHKTKITSCILLSESSDIAGKLLYCSLSVKKDRVSF